MYYPPYQAPPPMVYRRPMPTFEEYSEQQELKKYANQIGLATICNRIPYLLLSVFSGVFLMAFGLYNYKNSGNGFSGFDPIAYTLFSNLIYAICLAVPFLVLMRSFRGKADRILPFDKVGFKTTVLLVMTGLGACMAVNLQTNFTIAVGSIFGIPVPDMEQPYVEGAVYFILTAVLTALLPAVLEEFVFRGVILGSLRRFGDGFAVIVSAGLFALTHFYLPQLPMALGLGLLFGFLVVKTNSLLPGILIHFFNNFYATVMDEATHNMNDITASLVFYLTMGVLLLLGLLGFWRLLKSRKDLFTLPGRGGSVLPLKRKLAVFCSSAGMICLLVLLGLCVIVFTISIM